MIYVYQTGYVLEEGEHQYRKEHRIGRMLLRNGLKKVVWVEFDRRRTGRGTGGRQVWKATLQKLRFDSF